MPNYVKIQFVLLIITVYSSIYGKVKAELYTSTDELIELLETESHVIGKLQSYIAEEEEKISYIKKRIDEYIDHYDHAIENASEYVGNPINAYILIKRLSRDLQELDKIIKELPSVELFDKTINGGGLLSFPTDDDLRGSADAILRLQDTYNLNVSDMAEGKITGLLDDSPSLSSSDCFVIGKESFDSYKYANALLWFTESLKRYDNWNFTHDAPLVKIEILGHLAASYNGIGNRTESLRITNEILKQDPTNKDALKNQHYLQKHIDEVYEYEMRKVEQDYSFAIQPEQLKNTSWLSIYDLQQQIIYKKMCRQEIVSPPKQLAPLRCRYVTNKSAFLKIAPLKLEECSLDPYIVTYHEVIYDKEIEQLKEMSKRKLSRALVFNSKEGEKQKGANYRISKFAWMKDDEHKFVKDISRRVEDMTSLTTSTAEELQVLNYGIGGHYEPHFDFFLPVDYSKLTQGVHNRIATVLFYMSDVEKGGATVFPLINVSLWPRKGSAAFWYNLYRSGEGNFLTKHAGCPVLMGNKWVCNKWIHMFRQDFLRTCDLHPDHPEYI